MNLAQVVVGEPRERNDVMAKSKKKEKKGKPKKRFIKDLVLETLAKKPDISAREMRELVLKEFPDSAFGKTHLSWYKSQIRKGRFSLAGGKQLPPSTRGKDKKKKVKGKKKVKKAKVAKRAAHDDDDDDNGGENDED